MICGRRCDDNFWVLAVVVIGGGVDNFWVSAVVVIGGGKDTVL